RDGVRRRHRRTRALRAAAVCVLLLILGLGQLLRERGEVRFSDGSAARLLESGSALRALPAAPGRLVVALDRGAARFRVARAPRRIFRVEAGAVAVEVLGTQFVVSRRGPRVAVSVEEGQVRVRWLGGEEVLVAGARGTFPREAPPPAEPAPGA